ncbi:MAG: M23 family metallopeptidase [Lachnospiraceae bacterium]|nr:M23 family metallopeptidase [Lachnospiraceae bacterium]
MKKFNKQNLEHIKECFEHKTGVNLTDRKFEITGEICGVRSSKLPGPFRFRPVLLAGLAVCLLTFGAFGYAKFSSLASDDVNFQSAYQGEGVVKILVSNESNKTLELQKQIKLMRWSTGEEVVGDKDQIDYSDMIVEPGCSQVITIDLSKAYDVAMLEAELAEKDHYYFTLTNNDFAFGQDWMCSVDFEEKEIDVTLTWEENSTCEDAVIGLNPSYVFDEDSAEKQGGMATGVDDSKNESYVQPSYTAPLAFEDWTWPTVRESVTSKFGTPRGDSFTDHINIQGDKGDAVYAVADGTVLETGFDATYGYYVVLDLGEGIAVKYGHLQDTKVENGETVEKGQKIATLGATGMATGPNLAFFVYRDGEAINPLSVEDDM